MHAPVLGEIETLDGALIGVDTDGRIAGVSRNGDAGHDDLVRAVSDAGKLERLAPGQYLLPGLIDTHIHAPQWPQLGKALDRPLDVWLQTYTFPL